jgi:hypothetical protein
VAGNKTLTVTITGDASQVRRALKGVGDGVDEVDGKASKAASGWGSSMDLIGKASLIAVGAATAIGVGMGAMTVKGVQAAADLGESINAIQVTLGDGADSFLEFGEDSANSLGITQAALNQAVTPIAAILKNAGDSGDELSGKLQDLSTRATDVASVFNVDTTEAVDAFGAALRGESEPIRRFGVTLDEASVNAKAMELGLADASGEVDAAGKVQARYAIIMEQTNVAAGDFARTADSLPNTMKRLKASAEESLAALGAPLLAPLADGASGLAESLGAVEPILARMGGTMGTLVGPVSEVVDGFIAGLLPAFDAVSEVVDQFVTQIGPDLQEWAEDNGEAFADMGESIGSLIESAAPLITVLAEVTAAFLDFSSEGLKGLSTVVGWADAFASASSAMGPLGGLLGGFSADADQAGASGGGFADMVSEASEAAGGMEAPVGAAAEALIAQAEAATTAEERLDAWSEAVKEAFAGQLDIVGATEAFEASIDKVTESVMINGATIDLNTEAGRNNSAALRAAAEDAIALATAYAGEGKYEEAQTVLAGTRERIIEAGMAAGQSRDQMELYLATLGLTPEQIDTTLNVLGIPENEAALNEVTRDRETLALAKHYGTEAVDRALNHTARQRNQYTFAWANISAAARDLDYLTQPRTAWITVALRYSGQAAAYADGNVDVDYGRSAAPGGRSVVAGRSGRSTADLFTQRPVVVQIDGREVGRTPAVAAGVKDSLLRDRAAAGVR